MMLKGQDKRMVDHNIIFNWQVGYDRKVKKRLNDLTSKEIEKTRIYRLLQQKQQLS